MKGPSGLPVHEVTVFLGGYRTQGKAANTIHFICTAIGVLYKTLAKRPSIDLLSLLRQGEFLSVSVIARIVSAVQHPTVDSEDESELQPQVINLRTVRMRRATADETPVAINVSTFASRLRYIAYFLENLVDHFKVDLPPTAREALERRSAEWLKKFRAYIPRVTKRAKLGARQGLSNEEQDRLLAIVRPGSPDNPWTRGFVQRRNWVIVMMLLATGMRRGELLGMMISDLNTQAPTLQIKRRPDNHLDPRAQQEVAKTNERELELRPDLMRSIWTYVAERKTIPSARKHPYLIVSEDGAPLSGSAIGKIFTELRLACPGLPVTLTSHVMRHTWNERFSEQADAMGLSEVQEERARNEQQGWSTNSKTGATYTRRHTNRKGREMSLKLQEDLDAKAN